jgi:3-oxoacyl-[acyl-carrier protein] reductase
MKGVALITGGSRGIGRAIVEAFAESDYRVAFTFATAEKSALGVVAELEKKGAKAIAFQADVRSLERAEEVFRSVEGDLGPVSVLVNNAGIRRDVSLLNMKPSDWHEVIDTNLTGPFNYSRVASRAMMRAGGAIINVSSVSGITGMPGQCNYSASKAGLIGLTKALAKEMARFHVRVNAIAPGFIESEMTSSMDETLRKKLYATIPMGKPGDARDVARLALFLAGDDASYVTGQVYTVDGGLS